MSNVSFKVNLPTTILKDVEVFLQYIQEKTLEVTGNKRLLPNHCLPFLNASLSHPLKLKLQREQQISYPHINGLFLLTRSLGLIKISQNKSKRYLSLNHDVLNAWLKLNTTEKYFTLMQTWFFYSDARLINKNKRGIFNDILQEALYFVKLIQKDPIIIDDPKNQRVHLYRIQLYNLALLEMFGVVAVNDNENTSEKTWPISKILITEFGKKWISIFEEINLFEFMLDMIGGTANCVKHFHQKMSLYFPDWHDCLTPEKKITNANVHVFKVSLTKETWRKINVQGSEFLNTLAESILDAFNFDNDHLYEFRYTNSFGSIQVITHPACSDGPYADEIKVGDLDILCGDIIDFTYDFGDNWKFEVRLEKIDPELNINYPIVTEKKGQSPEQYSNIDY